MSALDRENEADAALVIEQLAVMMNRLDAISNERHPQFAASGAMGDARACVHTATLAAKRLHGNMIKKLTSLAGRGKDGAIYAFMCDDGTWLHFNDGYKRGALLCDAYKQHGDASIPFNLPDGVGHVIVMRIEEVTSFKLHPDQG